MWQLIITIMFYGDPATTTFTPAIESLSFSSKAKCETARSSYIADLKPVTDVITQEADAERADGAVKGNTGLMVSAICVAR
jgi:hypothetical protein